MNPCLKFRDAKRATRWYRDPTLRQVSTAHDRCVSPYFATLAADSLTWLRRGSRSAHVTEIGSGEGAVLRAVRQSMSPSQLRGIEPATELAATSKLCCPGAQITVQAAEDVRLPEDDADAVIIQLCLGLLENPRSVLEGAVRHLRPGGLLYVMDLDGSVGARPAPFGESPAVREFLADQLAVSYSEAELLQLLDLSATSARVGAFPLGLPFKSSELVSFVTEFPRHASWIHLTTARSGLLFAQIWKE